MKSAFDSSSSVYRSVSRGRTAADRRSSGEGEIFFTGVVSRITYRNEDTGFGVLRAEEDSANGAAVRTPTTVVGLIPETVRSGAHITARGEWQTHPKFGRQFKARSLTETEPTGRDAISRYLASGAVKGFGPVLAERIVEAFGERALDILDREPDRLLEVPGIGAKKLLEIKASWTQKRNLREVLLFFQNHNISLSIAQRIYNQYADRAIEIVSANPYVLAREVWGIGFQTADQIAVALGIEPASIQRARAGVLFALKKTSDDGHCFVPPDMLVARAQSLLGIEDEGAIREAIELGVQDGEIVREEDRLYLPALFEAERQLAAALAERLRNRDLVNTAIPEHLLERWMNAETAVPGADAGSVKMIRLSPAQQEAIRLAATQSILVITGGPGCGKTTVVRSVTRMLRESGLRISLAAPTGRAAQRMAEVCEMKASTIHRLLKFDPTTRNFVHNRENPLELDALVVDESSMIDLPLAASLLSAVPPNAHLVIVGDADQLPSVGPGLILADLLSIPEVPRVRLSTLFRRADESSITQIAHEINSAVVPEIPEPDGVTKSDAYFLKVNDAAEAAALVERLVVEQIPKRFGLRGSDITVLTPMNQGEIGVIALNERLQSHLVPTIEGLPKMVVGNLEFRLGDRVCQRVNNYQIHDSGVFNGDQGEVIGIDLETKSLIVRLWDGREVTYPPECLHQLDLAYALTIHRSQGSEVPAVILLLHESHSVLLERQLLYTAVTRAKKLLIIVGTRKALVLATKKSRSKRRFTTLADRTRSLLA